MAQVSRRLHLALDAIQSAKKLISSVPPSDERDKVLEEAQACERAAQAWSTTAPTTDEREAMMKRVLKLHSAASKLRRVSQPPPRP